MVSHRLCPRLLPYRPKAIGPDCEAITISPNAMLVIEPDGLVFMEKRWFYEYYAPLEERRWRVERRLRCGGRRRQDRTRANIKGERWPVEVKA